MEATFEGTATLTYEADQGAWSDVTDATKVVTNLTLNGTKDTPRTGQAGRTFEGTYRCSSTDLVLSSDDYRQAFQRAWPGIDPERPPIRVDHEVTAGKSDSS